MGKTHLTCAALYLVLTSLTVLSGCVIHIDDDHRAKHTLTQELTAPLAGVAHLNVDTNVGTIQLERAEGDVCRISVTITVRAKTPERAQELAEQVRIAVEPAGQTLTIKAIKPPGFGRSQLAVDFTIAAPGNLALECTTNVGDIRISGFDREIEARTDVGKIICIDAKSDIRARTNVGNIQIDYANAAPAVFELRAVTNVGDVSFGGPEAISAKVTASVNVGSIHTDRPVTVTGSMRKSINGTIGDGQGKIHLKTNVGSIRLR